MLAPIRRLPGDAILGGTLRNSLEEGISSSAPSKGNTGTKEVGT